MEESKDHYHINYSREIYYYVRVALMKYLSEFLRMQLSQNGHASEDQAGQIEQKQIPPRKLVVDYGCGFGLELCFLAKEFSGNKFIGYDSNLDRLDVARQRTKKYPGIKLQFVRGNYYRPEKAELSKADILYTNSPLAVPSISDGKLKQFLTMMKERVKIGGVYVLSGITSIKANCIPEELVLESNPVVCSCHGKDFYAYEFRRTA